MFVHLCSVHDSMMKKIISQLIRPAKIDYVEHFLPINARFQHDDLVEMSRQLEEKRQKYSRHISDNVWNSTTFIGSIALDLESLTSEH
jgi:hypothetical protein